MKQIAVCLSLAALACAPPSEEPAGRVDEEPAVAGDVATRLARFAPTEMRAELSSLADEDRQVLAELVTAARLMDEIFLRQVWTGNPDLRTRLTGLHGPGAEAARTYFAPTSAPGTGSTRWSRFLASGRTRRAPASTRRT